MKAHRLLPAALFLACIGSLSTVRTRHGQLTFSGSDSTEELKETSNHNPQHGSYRQNLESNGIPNLEVTAQHSRKILQDRNSQFGLTVQVRLTAIQLLGSEVRVYVRLERQSDNIVDNTQASAGQEDELVTTWISWATAPERRLSLQTNNAWAGGDSLDGLERRFRSGEPPSFANHEAETSLVFNEEFSVSISAIVFKPVISNQRFKSFTYLSVSSRAFLKVYIVQCFWTQLLVVLDPNVW